MFKHCAVISLIFHCLIYSATASLPEDIANTSTDCLTNSLESSIYCRGSRAIRNVINNLNKSEKPIVIVRGFEIVPTHSHNENSTNNSDKNITDSDDIGATDDDTFLGHFSRYLRTHELNIKFSDLMTDESKRDLARDLEQSGMQINDEARKKDKGNSMIMIIGIMMSKMMALMGLGGIGALAMKALGVAMTALMMAGIVGIKSLAQQGHEAPSHSVQYVSADGHHHKRRRRSNNVTASTTMDALFKREDVKTALPPLVYRGWQK